MERLYMTMIVFGLYLEPSVVISWAVSVKYVFIMGAMA